MIGLKSRLEEIFAASAFAEAGDRTTSLEIMRHSKRVRPYAWMQRLSDAFAGVAFAEAGLPEAAMDFMEKPARSPRPSKMETFLKEVGLTGVPMRYGVARI